MKATSPPQERTTMSDPQDRPRGLHEHPAIPHEAAAHEPHPHGEADFRSPPGAPSEAVVAIAHTTEKHRSIERVTRMVREALSHLGGMSRFVKLGQTVLIK